MSEREVIWRGKFVADPASLESLRKLRAEAKAATEQIERLNRAQTGRIGGGPASGGIGPASGGAATANPSAQNESLRRQREMVRHVADEERRRTDGLRLQAAAEADLQQKTERRHASLEKSLVRSAKGVEHLGRAFVLAGVVSAESMDSAIKHVAGFEAAIEGVKGIGSLGRGIGGMAKEIGLVGSGASTVTAVAGAGGAVAAVAAVGYGFVKLAQNGWALDKAILAAGNDLAWLAGKIGRFAADAGGWVYGKVFGSFSADSDKFLASQAARKKIDAENVKYATARGDILQPLREQRNAAAIAQMGQQELAAAKRMGAIGDLDSPTARARWGAELKLQELLGGNFRNVNESHDQRSIERQFNLVKTLQDEELKTARAIGEYRQESLRKVLDGEKKIVDSLRDQYKIASDANKQAEDDLRAGTLKFASAGSAEQVMAIEAHRKLRAGGELNPAEQKLLTELGGRADKARIEDQILRSVGGVGGRGAELFEGEIAARNQAQTLKQKIEVELKQHEALVVRFETDAQSLAQQTAEAVDALIAKHLATQVFATQAMLEKMQDLLGPGLTPTDLQRGAAKNIAAQAALQGGQQ